MRKNKKAGIISLEVLIGVVISVIIIVFAVNIIGKFFRLSDASKESFNQLVALIEEVNQNNHGTRKAMSLRMDDGTAIVGFSVGSESTASVGKINTGEYGIYPVTNYFDKPSECEKGKACICLYRELEREEGRKFKCKNENIICRSLDDTIFFSDGFIISRTTGLGEVFTTSSNIVSTEDTSQLRTIYVEKYEEYGENSVAVCGSTGENSCISQEYKELKNAIYSLKYFKTFIESCKDRREFLDVENPEPCSCWTFDFRSFIPEKYDVEFSESEKPDTDSTGDTEDTKDNHLKITLKEEDGEKELGSIEVNTPFCEYRIVRGEISIVPEKPITSLNGYIDSKYPLNAEPNPETTQIKPQIAFIKYDEENICLAYNDFSASDPNTIAMWYEVLDNPVRIEIPGCGYSVAEDGYSY